MSGHLASLKERALRSGGWVTGGYILSQVIRLGSNLILTRLLFPEAFGLMTIVFVLMTGFTLFSDFGVKQSIVQNKRGDQKEFLNTAWVVQICRGVLIWVSILVAAYFLPHIVGLGWVPIGSVYANPLLPSILSIISFVALIQGFESTKIALAQRNLEFKNITFMDIFSQIIALIVTVSGAVLYPSVWSLVYGVIVGAFVRCIVSHLYLQGMPNRIMWDSQCFHDIFHFGKWVFMLSILGFFVNNGDKILLGGLITPVQLGIYSIAFLLSGSLLGFFLAMMSKMVFPVFSEIFREQPSRLSVVYQRFQLITDIFLFSVAGLLMFSAEMIVAILYDSRYQDAGYMLSILSVSLIAIKYSVVHQCCLAMGELRYLFATTILVMISMYILLPFGYEMFGMKGALMFFVLSQFAGWPVAIYFIWKKGLIRWSTEVIGVPFFVVGALIGFLFSELYSRV